MVAHAQAPAETERPASPVALWRHIFGEGTGFLCLFSGRRPAPGDKRLLDVAETYWPYPQSLAFAEQEAYQQDALGREVYFCAHLLRRKRRVKASAGPIDALWTDGDGAPAPTGALCPTAIVESSPGRQQYFWRLAEPMEPAEAEGLNRRLAYAIGADKGGWDRTQLLRVPGCTNHKYADGPRVTVLGIAPERVVDAAALDALLPPAPEPAASAPPPASVGDNDDAEPPVRLGADGLAWWRGERVARKEDGGVDRSETLWGLGCALWDAGASGRTVISALTERDAALGYGCYTSRPAEYLRLVGKLERRGAEAAAPTLAMGGCPGCAERDRTIAQLREWNQVQTVAYQNKELKQEGRGAVGVAKVWRAHRERGDTIVDRETGKEYVHVPLAEAGREVGYSADTAGDALDKLHRFGLLEKKRANVPVRVVDEETGQVQERMASRMYVHLPEGDSPFLRAVGAFDPQKPPEERHGGYRPKRCEEHPEAPVAVATVRVETCGVCERETARTEVKVEYYSPEGEPISLADFRARTGNRQDAPFNTSLWEVSEPASCPSLLRNDTGGENAYGADVGTESRNRQDAGLTRGDSTLRPVGD
jgi:hypothetical protein